MQSENVSTGLSEVNSTCVGEQVEWKKFFLKLRSWSSQNWEIAGKSLYTEGKVLLS